VRVRNGSGPLLDSDGAVSFQASGWVNWTSVNVRFSYTCYLTTMSVAYRLQTGQARVQIPVCKGFLSFPKRPDWLWGPANLLFSGYQAFFPGGKAAAA